MQLSAHFTLEEFTASETAARRGIDNSLPPDLINHAVEAVQMLERIRTFLAGAAGREIPLFVTSGYRCAALNEAVGSAPTSDHPKAFAVDFHAPAFGKPLDICKALEPRLDELSIGQLIHEFGTWVHVSCNPVADPVNRVITIDREGTRSGLWPVR